MEEIWKPIEDYEGLYEVSNFGRVRSYMPPANSKLKKRTTSVIMKPRMNEHGYMVIGLGGRANLKMWKVHRLVAMHFINNTQGKPFINHIDGNKSNNRVDNLEWCTKSENMITKTKIR